MEKKKILVLADHPLAPSGVGTQTRYMIEALLATDRYKFICFGGAVKHQNNNPQKVEGYGDDWIIYPVEGYGTQEMVRSVMWTERPDVLWFMTDPRFYDWLWDMENEIRPNMPMVYYHVWDNYPLPVYNKPSYESTDVIACISKLTHEIVKKTAPDVESCYLPHAVDTGIFRPLERSEIAEFKKQQFGEDDGRFTFFWNNRNARRKMSGSLLWWFNEFAEEVGPENVRLIMHTDPKDPHGQDLEAMIYSLGAADGRIMLSKQKVPPEVLAMMYNACDVTLNISDAEGFGLSTLESLSCATPIVVNLTGGLQEQVTNGEDWFGIGLNPASKAVIGSQMVPYIYEDRVSKEDFIAALKTLYNMPREELEQLGRHGHGHVLKNYNFDQFCSRWVDLIDKVVEQHGSWEERKGYKSWSLREI